MKTSVLDFVVCGVAIGAILAGAIAVTWALIRPLTTALLSEYHVVADFFAGLALYGALSALAVRVLLVVRRLEPGEYSMDSPVFAYWKVLTILYRLGQAALLPLTPVFARPWVQMLYGARVGADVALGGTIDDPYLISIGDGAVLGNNSLVAGSVVANGRITLGRVAIGAGATVRVNAVVLPGTDVGDGALLIGGSMVLAGTKIPPGETWRGNPARKWQ
jgi:carbonic anhydrase/acetyltransferase-like protein (isoleucine patch superfamily)